MTEISIDSLTRWLLMVMTFSIVLIATVFWFHITDYKKIFQEINESLKSLVKDKQEKGGGKDG